MLTNGVIALAMILSIVFLSEAISSTNPLSVTAQSTQYTSSPSYKKKTYSGYAPHYRTIRVKRAYYAKVLRYKWVTKTVKVYPRYRWVTKRYRVKYYPRYTHKKHPYTPVKSPYKPKKAYYFPR